MKIIFLNTWHGELRNELRAYIERNIDDTSVFCFQEAHAKDRPYEDLLEGGYAHHTVQRQNPNDGSWFANVLYVRKDIHITETGGIFTDPEKDINFGIVAYLTLKINNTFLTICNVHGTPYPGHKLDTPVRLHQSQTILNTFAGHEAVIIGGDFNLLPETKSVQTFDEHGYQNLIADFDIKTTRNHITFDRYPDNIQHYADYTFVSSDMKVINFEVPTDVVSDHQPLELNIAIEQPQRTLETTETNVHVV